MKTRATSNPSAQTRAMQAVNSELVRLYWAIGRMINARQKLEGWGSGVTPRLAAELKNEMPELKGFSERNIGLMIAFHREYPDPAAILQQPVAKLTEGSIVQCPVAQIEGASFWSIPWAHHVILIQKIKDLSVRRWYMEQALTNGRSRQPRPFSNRRNCSAVTGQRMRHSHLKWAFPAMVAAVVKGGERILKLESVRGIKEYYRI